MNVFILTLGTRGDVELFVTLGRELRRRGHLVLIGTSAFYSERIRGAGLEHLAVGPGTREQLAGVLRSFSAIGDPKARTMEFVRQWLVPQLKGGMRDVRLCAAAADFFISNLRFSVPTGGRDVPTAFVTYDVPADVRDHARLAPPEGEQRILDLVAMNQPLVDPGRRWGPQFRFTGFWLEPRPAAYAPPQDLLRFLAAGEPPVVVTLGSMSAVRAAGSTDRLTDAVRAAGQRAIVIGGATGPGAASNATPHALHVREEIPYLWLFPRCSAVIHHGGIGTVAASLVCGTPSVLLPHISAQWRIAQTLRDAGVATGVLDPAATDAGPLVAAIGDALHDPGVKVSTEKWKHLLSQDRGAATAADLIESHAGSRGA